MGERAGNANLGEIALALRALYGVESGLRSISPQARSRTGPELSGYELEPWKPLVGENLFRRESGAVASQFHDPPSIEPYSSELVGAERSIVLGKKSGLDSIRIKAEELGLDVPEERARRAAGRVKARGAEQAGARHRRGVPRHGRGGGAHEPSPRARQPAGAPSRAGLQPRRRRAAARSSTSPASSEPGRGLLALADDLYGQTAGAMRNLEVAMDAVGVRWDDIVRRTIYTTQPTEYETITRAIDEVTGGAEHPAQTLVGITGLAVPGCLIEIECTAVVDETQGRTLSTPSSSAAASTRSVRGPARARRLGRLRPRAQRRARRRDPDRRDHGARISPRSLQRLAPALGRRGGARAARRGPRGSRARVPEHRAADGDALPGR